MEGVQLVLRKHGLQQRRLQFQAPRCEQGDAMQCGLSRGGAAARGAAVCKRNRVSVGIRQFVSRLSRRVLVTRHASPPPLGSKPLNLRTVFLYSS